jgi:hypothetical protein
VDDLGRRAEAERQAEADRLGIEHQSTAARLTLISSWRFALVPTPGKKFVPSAGSFPLHA